MGPVKLTLLACVATLVLHSELGGAVAEPDSVPSAGEGGGTPDSVQSAPALDTPTPAVSKATPTPAVSQTTPTSPICKTTPTPAVGKTTPTPAVSQTTPTSPICKTTPSPAAGKTTPTPAVSQTTPTSPICKATPPPAVADNPQSAPGPPSPLISNPIVNIYGNVKIIVINQPAGLQPISVVDSQTINTVNNAPVPPSKAPVLRGPGAAPRSPCSSSSSSSSSRPAFTRPPCPFARGPAAPRTRPGTASRFQGLICGGQKGQIQCLFGKSLQVETAVYGRQKTFVCWNLYHSASTTRNTNCRRDVTGRLRDLCSGKNVCSIHVTDATMGGDPCPGTSKYLTIEARCV